MSINSDSRIVEIGTDALLANASDPDGPIVFSNLGSPDPNVKVALLGDTVVVTAPAGTNDIVTITYDVSDSAAPPASTQATAEITIDTTTLPPSPGDQIIGPDGVSRTRLADDSGGSGGFNVTFGTGGNDAVILNSQTPYSGIDSFRLLAGSDFVDLGGSSAPVTIRGGGGEDMILGGAGDDTLIGGADADTLFGGLGADRFTLDDLTATDQILDYAGGSAGGDGDQIDLQDLVDLGLGENLSDHVGYDAQSGALSVDGSLVAIVHAGTGDFAADVEVIFTNAAGAQETAVV